MILGLSHVGLTVSAPGPAVEFYRERFHCGVVSDAERRGEIAERITGVPGIHTRNIYLSIGPKQHLEVFVFYQPPMLPALKEKEFRAGISYVAFMKDRRDFPEEPAPAEGKPSWAKAFKPLREYPFDESQVVTEEDPDGLLIRTLLSGGAGMVDSIFSGTGLLYAGLLTADMESSLDFWVGVLALALASAGEQPWPAPLGRSPNQCGSARWALLASPIGSPCVKLIQPLDSKAQAAGEWEMQRVGFTHFALAVREIESCYASLLKKGACCQSTPQCATAGPHAGGKGVYLRTPEGGIVELIDSPLTRAQTGNGR